MPPLAPAWLPAGLSRLPHSRSPAKRDLVRAKVISVSDLSSDAKLVRIRVRRNVDFLAGQYLLVRKDIPNQDGSSPGTIFPGTYSIASPPGDLPEMAFMVQRDANPRSMRHYMFYNAKKGDVVYVDACGYGSVAITAKMVAAPLAWTGGGGGICLIAGGFGVPALMSIARQVLEKPGSSGPIKTTVLHSARVDAGKGPACRQIPFYQEFSAMAERYDQLDVIHTVTGEAEGWSGRVGRIDRDLLCQVAQFHKIFCVYGSGQFVRSIVATLVELGVWPANIRTDVSSRLDPSKEHARAEKTLDSHSSGDGSLLRQSSYLAQTGVGTLLASVGNDLDVRRPEQPVSYTLERLQSYLQKHPEIQNAESLKPDFWRSYWEEDSITWHSPEVSPWLIRHEEALLGCSGTSKRVFVPLCGKAADMVYLLSRGHTVIGAECSGIACADFFAENRIPNYQREVVRTEPLIVRHFSSSVSISLYEADIFTLDRKVVGQVDAILDRAALVALHPSCIESKYLPLLTSLLDGNGRMLLASVSRLPRPAAPPHVYGTSQIERILYKWFDDTECLEEYRYEVAAGEVVEPIYCLSSARRKQATLKAASAYA